MGSCHPVKVRFSAWLPLKNASLILSSALCTIWNKYLKSWVSLCNFKEIILFKYINQDCTFLHTDGEPPLIHISMSKMALVSYYQNRKRRGPKGQAWSCFSTQYTRVLFSWPSLCRTPSHTPLFSFRKQNAEDASTEIELHSCFCKG